MVARALHLIAHPSPPISSQFIIPSPFRLPSLQKETLYNYRPQPQQPVCLHTVQNTIVLKWLSIRVAWRSLKKK